MVRDNNEDEWNKYWEEGNSGKFFERLYSKIASFYRNYLIGPRLSFVMKNYVEQGSSLLHAGSGAGEVDKIIIDKYQITAMDISSQALMKYQSRYPDAQLVKGDITECKIYDKKFDGIYNLGVMEHLTPNQIVKSVNEFSKLLEPKGKLIFFWPPVYGLSVLFLTVVHFILNRIFKKNLILHPEEPNKVSTKKKFMQYIEGSDFKLIYFGMSPRDLFTYCVIVLEKQ